jgi:hypothetical protein
LLQQGAILDFLPRSQRLEPPRSTTMGRYNIFKALRAAVHKGIDVYFDKSA